MLPGSINAHSIIILQKYKFFSFRARSMDKTLLEILACPICKGELLYDQSNQELVCRFDRLAFPIVNNIPVMLEGRARRLTMEEE